MIWCLPITENLSGVGISKESATINLEKQLKECIEEINRDLKAAYQTGEVCNSKYGKITKDYLANILMEGLKLWICYLSFYLIFLQDHISNCFDFIFVTHPKNQD